MNCERPIRHRLGILLTCLFALLTLREGPPTGEPQKKPPSVPIAAGSVEQDYRSEIISESVREKFLRPVCSMEGNAALPCCDLPPPHAEVELAGLEWAINPDPSPHVSDFGPEAGQPESSTVVSDLLQQDRDIMARDIVDNPSGAWPVTRQRCRKVEKDWNGKEYCSPDKEMHEIPEPGVLGLVVSGVVGLMVFKRRR